MLGGTGTKERFGQTSESHHSCMPIDVQIRDTIDGTTKSRRASVMKHYSPVRTTGERIHYGRKFSRLSLPNGVAVAALLLLVATVVN